MVKVIRFLLVLCSLFSVLAHASEPPYTLVLDIDDTLRETDVKSSLVRAARNALWGKDTFPGMKELSLLLSSKAQKTVYLSAAPESLRNRVHEFLVGNEGFPDGTFILRNFWSYDNLRHFGSGVFKTARLNELVAQTKDSFLLVGDDTEDDAEVFSALRQSTRVESTDAEPQDRVLRAYVHQVTGKALPSGVIPFVTAFDIALHELEAGNFSLQETLSVGHAIADPTRMSLVFPDYKHCPEGFEYSMGTAESFFLGPIASTHIDLIALSSEIRALIHYYCKERSTSHEAVAELAQ